MKEKIVIVGGVAGGATFAARLRRLSEDYEIIMFEKDEYIAFANCGLPYYIGGVIEDRDLLSVQTVEGLSKRYNLDIRNFSEVIKIDEKSKTVLVKNHKENKEYEESYDKLILSPGASPIVPPFQGLADANNVFTLRNIPDTDQIKSYIDKNKPKKAVVIGGGFIGVEMAENLAHLGIEVTLVDLAKHVLKPFDQEMASILELNLQENGVELLLGKQVQDVTSKQVELTDGTIIDTDVTIMAIGVKPNSKLLEDIGGNLSQNKAIITNEKFETSIKDIYAIGDVIEITNPILNNKMHIPLAWPANRQARLLADIISGKDLGYKGTLGASILKVNELTAASVGYTEEFLDFINEDHDSVIITKGSRAGYYPGGSNMHLKLVFNKSGKILGAQAIGADGVDKRIDVIATAIKLGAKVHDLQDLEVCYAPPFNSAKDPVNIVGYTAENIISGASDSFKYTEIENIINDDQKVLIDVRTPNEVLMGAIDGSINIPLDEIRDNKAQLDKYKGKELYIYCQVGLRGYVAEQILKSYGFKTYNLSGGYAIYNYHSKNCNKKKTKNEQQINNSVANTLPSNDNLQSKNTTRHEIDARGLQCPGPIAKTASKMEEISTGDELVIKVTDKGFCEDINSWCNKCGNQLNSITKKDDYYEVIITKPEDKDCKTTSVTNSDKGTIVMFSGDLDKSLAAMIIAQGAQAMNKQMTIFFTFWGLNLLRKDENVDVDKTNFEKMFGMMMPKGADKLKLSKMNMGGLGTSMIKSRMKAKNVPDLKEQIKLAQEAGVKFVACTMSMDLMGLQEEELIDGLEFGGVATYIGESSGADLTLFI